MTQRKFQLQFGQHYEGEDGRQFPSSTATLRIPN